MTTSREKISRRVREIPSLLKPFWTVDNISKATDTIYLNYELDAKSLVGARLI